ncbi:uncharacterized protein CANTADRAFT_25033 [Suhomyces tanzawaensis NRRL Y-17324]|uniref:Uncharacterized protein n=1 Tax=Suhomyces tanzawaensis NRRL Y-17324 TaxID=984487 RepID=A0A1E4SLW8_9ASCO|nr:uncharacterized protein CANTADRAFT_25033 [Suhomyces tanzawaensis NRRL Y-17324]ODV80519.1 hypothetical protein CANTADRAFT_25033 [Suhomyces tanzawaensis NRRL Y-17324]
MSTFVTRTLLELSKRDGLPPLRTTTRAAATGSGGMPVLASNAAQTTSESFTTPAIKVPNSIVNPHILRETNPSGTVFIAVGAIVGAIIIAFILYHLIVSLTASRLAKKSLAGDRQLYEKYQNNNNTAYGGAAGLTPTNMTFDSKLPFLSPTKTVLTGLGGGMGGGMGSLAGGSVVGDNSTIYASEAGAATSKHDLTKMFISPTAEVMQHKRVRSSQYGGSTTNLSMLGGSTTNLIPASNRHSQMPSLYINNDNNSEYSLSQAGSAPHQGHTPRSNRKTIPSMYLEDLIDEK